MDKYKKIVRYLFSLPNLLSVSFIGTKGPQLEDFVVPDKASLYSFEQDHKMHVHTQLRPVTISNGLVWSLNDTVMYYIDSPTKKIEAFDFDSQKGEISESNMAVIVITLTKTKVPHPAARQKIVN